MAGNALALIKRCVKGDNKKQFVMLGLDGAGKTTLLYRLKVPGWKKEELLKDLQRVHETKDPQYMDPGYHYEEFKGTTFSYSIWDVPGGQTMRHSWPAFYRYIKVSALIFVVDGSETGEDEKTLERIAEARRWLHFLLAEDELRSTCFVIIVNDKQESGRTKLQPYDINVDPLYWMLGIDKILEEEVNRNRVKRFTFDVSHIEGEGHGDWAKVITEIDKYQIAFGGVG